MYPSITIYSVGKDAGIRVRIDQELRAVFVAACHRDGKNASEGLREFDQECPVRDGHLSRRDLFESKQAQRKPQQVLISFYEQCQ